MSQMLLRFAGCCPLISLPQIKLPSVLTASAQTFIYLSYLVNTDPVPLAIFSKQKEKLIQFIRKCPQPADGCKVSATHIRILKELC